MSNMSLEVSFLAETDVKDAIIEARNKAQLFNVAYVCFNFNTCKFSVSPGCDVKSLYSEWLSSQREGEFFVG